eukprot:gene3749-7443_t
MQIFVDNVISVRSLPKSPRKITAQINYFYTVKNMNELLLFKLLSLNFLVIVAAVNIGKIGTKVNNNHVQDQLNESDDESEDIDGGIAERIMSRDFMYGADFMNQRGYGQNYILQVETRMKSPVVGNSWESLGPKYSTFPNLDTGRINDILIHPTIKTIVYVLSSGGGLWKTINFFDTNPIWIPLTDTLTTSNGGAAVLGSDPDTLYLGLGDFTDRIGVGGLFTKSSDGGNIWSIPVDLSQFNNIIISDRVTQILEMVVDNNFGSDILMIATDIGIFRSIDEGSTFAHVYHATDGQYHPQVYSLLKTSIGWISYDSANKVFLSSTDLGATWSTPVSSTWLTITGSKAGRTTFTAGHSTTTTTFSSSSIVYALVANGDVTDVRYGTTLDLYKSVDGGLTWTSLHVNADFAPSNPISYLQTDLNILGTQGYYNQMVLVDPSDSTGNTIYIGGQLVLMKSTDGGNTWEVLTTWYSVTYFAQSPYLLSYIHAGFHCAVFVPSPSSSLSASSPSGSGSGSGGGTLLIGTDGGLFSSSNHGVTWSSEVNRGLVTHLSNFIAGTPSGNRLMIGLQDLGTRERVNERVTYTDNNTDTATTTTVSSTSSIAASSSFSRWEWVYEGDGNGCGYSQGLDKVNIVSYNSNNFACRYYTANESDTDSKDDDNDNEDGVYSAFSVCNDGITDEESDKAYHTTLAVPTAAADPTGTIFFTLTHKSIYRSSISTSSSTRSSNGTGTGIVWTVIGTIGNDGISSVSEFRDTAHSIAISPTTTHRIAVIKDMEICITTNGGSSWTTVSISSSIPSWTKSTSPVWASSFSSSTVLYLASEDPTIGAIRFIKSTDTGSTWTDPSTAGRRRGRGIRTTTTTSSVLPDVPISKLTVSNSDPSGNTVYAGTWIGAYITTDGGLNWNVLGSKLPNIVVTDIYEGTYNIYVSTYGRGVWQLDSSSLGPVSAASATPPTKTLSVGCIVEHPEWIGNHICNDKADGSYNTAECGYDGGDCCEQTCGDYSTCGGYSESNPFNCLDPLYKDLDHSHTSTSDVKLISPSTSGPIPSKSPVTVITPTAAVPSRLPTYKPSKKRTTEPSMKPTSTPTDINNTPSTQSGRIYRQRNLRVNHL